MWQKQQELTLPCLYSEQFLTRSSQPQLQLLFLWDFAVPRWVPGASSCWDLPQDTQSLSGLPQHGIENCRAAFSLGPLSPHTGVGGGPQHPSHILEILTVFVHKHL